MYTHATLQQREISSFCGNRNLFSFFLSDVTAGAPHVQFRRDFLSGLYEFQETIERGPLRVLVYVVVNGCNAICQKRPITCHKRQDTCQKRHETCQKRPITCLSGGYD